MNTYTFDEFGNIYFFDEQNVSPECYINDVDVNPTSNNKYNLDMLCEELKKIQINNSKLYLKIDDKNIEKFINENKHYLKNKCEYELKITRSEVTITKTFIFTMFKDENVICGFIYIGELKI